MTEVDEGILGYILNLPKKYKMNESDTLAFLSLIYLGVVAMKKCSDLGVEDEVMNEHKKTMNRIMGEN